MYTHIKYHKIPKVDKSVCTAEQMIAYNYAFAYADRYRDTWKKDKDKYCNFQRQEFIHEAIAFCMKMIMTSEKVKAKYDIDGIQAALNAGMENYFENKYSILTSYEDVGKIFPANYLDL